MDIGRRQTVVITGASAGLGAALARRYAADGAAVGLIARRSAELRALAAEHPGQCHVQSADVRNSAALRAAADALLAAHGLPDIVIANAGVSIGTLTDAAEDEQAFRDVIETNVIGMMNTFQPYVAAMRARGRGVLAGIASVAGYRGLPGSGAYSAYRAAAMRYLESLCVELRGGGDTVITICPGSIVTAMTANNPPQHAVHHHRGTRRLSHRPQRRAPQNLCRDPVADGADCAADAVHAAPAP